VQQNVPDGGQGQGALQLLSHQDERDGELPVQLLWHGVEKRFGRSQPRAYAHYPKIHSVRVQNN